jgi:hypothetical protein
LQLLNLLFMQWSRETIKDPELNMCYSIQWRKLTGGRLAGLY